MVLWKNGIFSSSALKHAILRHFLTPKLLLTIFFGFLVVFYADLPCFYRFLSPIVLKTSCKWAKTTKNWHQPPPPGSYCQLFLIDRRNRALEVSLEYGRLFESDMAGLINIIFYSALTFNRLSERKCTKVCTNYMYFYTIKHVI